MSLLLDNKYKVQIPHKTYKLKAKCWSSIANEFNAMVSGNVFRAAEVLRKKYEKKKNVKRKHANEKCYMRGTGGGPTKVTNFDNIESEIIEILGPRIEGLSSEFGGDANNSADPTKVSGSGNDLLLVENVQFDFIESDFNNDQARQDTINKEDVLKNLDVGDWSEYTPEMLRTKKSTALQVPKSNNIRMSFYKSSCGRLQKEMFERATCSTNAASRKKTYLRIKTYGTEGSIRNTSINLEYTPDMLRTKKSAALQIPKSWISPILACLHHRLILPITLKS
ncbi:hypothetical protein ABEB36_014445 [Hypothenemus hampei]|uniref:Regulatory protein zeste n=1 Tax=Hypothenemus hampei TaxID=57062 RepID=A0ABD1E234_HYPHA